jgi:hypothetical protein
VSDDAVAPAFVPPASNAATARTTTNLRLPMNPLFNRVDGTTQNGFHEMSRE